MTAGLSASPLEFTKEFAQVLPHAQVVKGPEELTIGPGAGQTADDPVLLELATTQLRAWLQTYPEIDAVYLSMPEFPDWDAQAESSWETLSERVGSEKIPSLGQLTETARSRPLIASKEL